MDTEYMIIDAERMITLLKATAEYLKNVRESTYSDALTVTTFYDEADCDGYCLLDDIQAELELIEED